MSRAGRPFGSLAPGWTKRFGANWLCTSESWEPKKARIKVKLILPEEKPFSETLGLQRRIISLVDVQIQVFPLGEKKMMQSV